MHKETENGEPVTHISKTESRAASPTRSTRNILVISLALIAILMAVAVGFGFFEAGQTGADDVNGDNATSAVNVAN